MSLFYCPVCKSESYGFDIGIESMIKTAINVRDGQGFFIIHYKCPNCDNLLAGFIQRVDKDYIEYFKEIITEYNEGGSYFIPELLDLASKNYELSKGK
jgi:uncharacterized C2H2 Zn-finger protein